MRKSFIIHNDSLGVLDDLSDEQCGELFKAIKAYQLGDEVELSPIVKIAFSPFRNQFARDLIKYENTCIARAAAGSKGGKQKVANASNSKQKVASVADSVSKSKNDSKSDSDNKSKYSSDDYSLSVGMFELICHVAPHTKKPDYEKWADTIRLMREVDGIPIATIQQVFKWANSDSFWRTNILSAAKLRKQFNQLQAKMVNNNETNQRSNQGGRSSVVDRAHAAAAERERARQAREGIRPAMGETAGSIRPPVEQPVRGDDTPELGGIIDGSYSRTD